MKKKKVNFKYNLTYFVKFNTRKKVKVIFDDEIQEIVKSLKEYLNTKNVNLIQINSEHNYDITIKMTVPPNVALSDLVYNMKRLSFSDLYKKPKVREALKGEHAMWTRQYVVSQKEEDLSKMLIELENENA